MPKQKTGRPPGRPRKNVTPAAEFNPEPAAAPPVNGGSDRKQQPLEYDVETPAPEPMVRRDEPADQVKRESRLAFCITPDGKIDLDAMTKPAVEKIRQAFEADPYSAVKFGFPDLAREAMETADPVSAGHIEDLFCAINDILISLVSKRTRLPSAELHSVLDYSQPELDRFCPQGARLANRYIPASWGKWTDLTQFGMSVYRVHQLKYLALQEYLVKKQEAYLAEHNMAARPQPVI